MTRALLILALAVSACSRPDASADVRPQPATGSAFLDTEWRLERVDGAPPDALPGGDALVTVAFTDAPFGDLDPASWSLGGYDGCNDFGMAYSLDGDPASAEGAAFRTGMVAANAMACGAPGEHVSDRVHRGLGTARRVRLVGDRLAFFDSLGTERVSFVPRPARSVDPAAFGTGRWRLDPAASTVTDGSGQALQPYAVSFRADSTYVLEVGCATFGGTYVLAGDRFRLTSSGPGDTSACGPEERPWDAELGLATGEVEADADRLVLTHRRDSRRLVFGRP